MIDNKLAESAFMGTSFQPERRAECVRKEYVNHLAEVEAELTPLAQNDEQKALLDDELSRYRYGYRQRMNAYLAARGRVMSPMITGPARFPVERNRKAARSADRRFEEMNEWSERALRSIRRKLIAARTPEQASDAEFNRLKKRIEGNLYTLREIQTQNAPWDPDAFKNSIVGAIKRSADAGNIEAAKRAVEYLREAQKALPKPAFTARHSIWTYVEKKAATASETKTGEEPIASFEGAEIINNHDEERVQILFDEIPSEEVRTELKSSGWRFSPRNKAWQRKNTANAVHQSQEIIRRFYQEVRPCSANS